MTTRRYPVRIGVRLDPGVNDPQGNTVRDGLHALGHEDVRDVRVGKTICFTLEAGDAGEAHARAEELCRDLLANPVIETFEIDVAEPIPPEPPPGREA
jgi:phosphoribosylformylglycinamidine synthase